MSRIDWRAWGLAATVGAGGGLLSWLLAEVALLAVTTAIASAAAARLAARHPDTVHESGVAWWAVGRWSAITTALLVGLAIGGTAWLDIAVGRLLALQLFVVGVGAATWLLGVSYAREKR